MKIPIFDTHAHMDIRSANEYELMAVSGVECIIVPCTYTREVRKTKYAFFQYYDKLLNLETRRALVFGVKLYVAISVHPEDITDPAVARDVLDILPEYLKNPYVCAIGEIGLEKFTDIEIEVFYRQLHLAKEYDLPVIMHTPHHNKQENLEKMVAILEDAIDKYQLDKTRLLIDDLSVDDFETVYHLDLGGYGIAVSPTIGGLFILHRKANAEEAYNLIQRYGTKSIIFNSALAFGSGDPQGIARVLLHLKMKGIDEESLVKLAYSNGAAFFSRCRVGVN